MLPKQKSVRLYGAIAALLISSFAWSEAQAQPVAPANNADSPARLKRLAPQEKEIIFGNAQERQQKYEARFKAAPLEIQQRILKERATIAQNHKRYTVGVTSVSAGGFKRITGLTPFPPAMKKPRPHPSNAPQQSSCLEENATASMPAVDMTDFAIVTPVRMQGGCGDCWAFGVTAALESAVLRANGNFNGITNTSLALSEEQVLSCTGPTDTVFGITVSGDNCGGGMSTAGANYVTDHSIVTNATWAYAGASQSSQCSHFQGEATPFRARDWGWVCDPGSGIGELLSTVEGSCLTPPNLSIKQAIVDHGSVAASFNVGGDCNNTPGEPSFCDYTGGIYDDETHNTSYGPVPAVDHVMQIVGWDDSKGAWRVKNSWGPDWGENGFVWIAYNTGNIGSYSVWVDADQYNNNACAVQQGARFKQLTVEITTGGDDARDNSEVYATLNNGFEFCLKPSSSGPTPHCNLPGNKDQNGANHWDNNYANPRPQVFDLPANDAAPSSMTLTLVSHNGTFQGDDNWDIQSVAVYGIPANGGSETRLFYLSNPASQPCIARLKHSPNSESVTLSLDGANKHVYAGGNASGRVSNCNNNGG